MNPPGPRAPLLQGAAGRALVLAGFPVVAAMPATGRASDGAAAPSREALRERVESLPATPGRPSAAGIGRRAR
jgi:hypothetical protein